MLEQKYSNPSNLIASYSYIDLSSGLGYIPFYPTISIGASMPEYILFDKTIAAYTTTGTLAPSVTTPFVTSDFNSPRTIKGNAIISGYCSGGTGGIVCDIIHTSGTVTATDLGEVIGSSAGVVQNSTETYTEIKTIDVDDYVNKTTGNVYGSGGHTGYVYIKYYYGGGNYATTYPASGVASTPYNIVNPNPTFRVYRVGIWLKSSASGYAASENSTQVYAQNTMGHTWISLGTKTTAAITVSGGFSISIPLTQDHIKIGDNIVFEIKKTTGTVVCDPTLVVETHETLKLNLPFRIDE